MLCATVFLRACQGGGLSPATLWGLGVELRSSGLSTSASKAPPPWLNPQFSVCSYLSFRHNQLPISIIIIKTTTVNKECIWPRHAYNIISYNYDSPLVRLSLHCRCITKLKSTSSFSKLWGQQVLAESVHSLPSLTHNALLV